MQKQRRPHLWGSIALSLALTVPIAACGDDDDGSSATTSNGTTATSNGTTGTSNGTTATSNGTTATSNGTTATSNGTTATSNGTTATSNGTTATSNGTTGGMPEAYTFEECDKPTPAGDLVPGVYDVTGSCWEVNPVEAAAAVCPELIVTDYTSSVTGALTLLGDAYIQEMDIDFTFGAWLPQECVDTLGTDCAGLPALIAGINPAISGTCAVDDTYGGCQCEGEASLPFDSFGNLEQDAPGMITVSSIGDAGVEEDDLIVDFDGSGGALAFDGDEPGDNWSLDFDYIEADTCLLYCTAFMGACNDAPGVEGYNNFDSCMSTCGGFSSTNAEPPVTGGNNIECRMYHVQAALDPSDAGNLALHCPHAALDGGGVCVGEPVTLCGEYCDLMEANCSENSPFNDRDGCMTACADYPDDGMEGATAGDSVQCRIYHAGDPAAGEPVTHCPHAGPSGAGICVDAEPTLCETYCDLIEDNCDNNNPFNDRAGCMTACADYPEDGTDGDDAGNTVQCRIYHAGDPAAADAGLHCPHAGPDGAGVCVDPPTLCGTYCDLIEDNCSANNPFNDRDGCMTACADYPEDGVDGDTSGDNVQCRIYHAGVAADDAPLHCPHAGPDGAGVCVDAGPTLCETYCDLIEDNCSANNPFNDRDGCMTACADYPADGTDGDLAGDTVQCRIYHAGDPAFVDPVIHCPHAGPDGAGVCVPPPTLCETYCSLIEGNCANNNPFNDTAACMTACAQYPEDGTDGDVDGDTVQCRIYHAGDPAVEDAALHCPHAGPDGAGVCVAPPTLCETYCGLIEGNCANNNPFNDTAACLTACADYPEDGVDGDTGGDTVQCRIYHAGVAADDAPLHCPHAGPDGAGVCVAPPTLCETYCNLMEDNCSENSPFNDRDGCLTACDQYPEDGVDGDTSGDNVQCRIYHAGVAADDAALHCPHAGPDGAGVCIGIEVSVVPGDFAITEIMKNPSNPNDSSGEWFEILNLTDEMLDINGLELADEDNDSFIVDNGGPLMVGAGEYFVFGNSEEEYVDFVYSGISMGNGTDEILMRNQSGEVIDVVAYSDSAFPDSTNTAFQFGDNFDPDSDDNNDGSTWCDATDAISENNSDLGTPGEANGACEPPPEPVEVTIYEVRNPQEANHPEAGTPVIIDGAVVTAISGNNAFAQAPNGGEWSGIYLKVGGVDAEGVEPGSVIDFEGLYTEDDIGNIGMGTLSTVTLSALTVVDSGAAIPAPTLVDDPGDLSDPATAEPWESTLVEVNDVTVTVAPNNFDEFEVTGNNDGDGTVLVDDFLFNYTNPLLDDVFESLVGPLNYSFGNFKIVPRDGDDLVLGAGQLVYTAQEVQDVFTNNCAGCHIGGTSGGMSLVDFVSNSSATGVIDVAAGRGGGADRIEPGDADASFLINKLEGTQGANGGSRMPLGRAPLSADDIEGIRGYINSLP